MSKAVLHQPVPVLHAPLLSLNTESNVFALENYRGRYVVLFFYPRDNTPGCTLESQDFSRLQKDFAAANAVVFGLSRDSLKSHARFQTTCELSVPLISDENEAICSIFEVVKDKTMYGKPVRGIERSTFIIDPNGKLVQEWRKVKVDGHAEEVLAWIKNQAGSINS